MIYKEKFQEYLMGKCIEDTHALDDDLPDAFEDWICEQGVENIIYWAEIWGLEQERRMLKETLKKLTGELMGNK